MVRAFFLIGLILFQPAHANWVVGNYWNTGFDECVPHIIGLRADSPNKPVPASEDSETKEEAIRLLEAFTGGDYFPRQTGDTNGAADAIHRFSMIAREISGGVKVTVMGPDGEPVGEQPFRVVSVTRGRDQIEKLMLSRRNPPLMGEESDHTASTLYRLLDRAVAFPLIGALVFGFGGYGLVHEIASNNIGAAAFILGAWWLLRHLPEMALRSWRITSPIPSAEVSFARVLDHLGPGRWHSWSLDRNIDSNVIQRMTDSGEIRVQDRTDFYYTDISPSSTIGRTGTKLRLPWISNFRAKPQLTNLVVDELMMIDPETGEPVLVSTALVTPVYSTP